MNRFNNKKESERNTCEKIKISQYSLKHHREIVDTVVQPDNLWLHHHFIIFQMITFLSKAYQTMYSTARVKKRSRKWAFCIHKRAGQCKIGCADKCISRSFLTRTWSTDIRRLLCLYWRALQVVRWVCRLADDHALVNFNLQWKQSVLRIVDTYRVVIQSHCFVGQVLHVFSQVNDLQLINDFLKLCSFW